jgi:uncharacterized protein YkwD
MRRYLFVCLFILACATPLALAAEPVYTSAPLDSPFVPGTPGITPLAADEATFAERVLMIVNQERWHNGQLPPLKGNALLNDAAITHSSNMAVRNFVAHCDLDTHSSPWDRMNAAGYTGYNYAGENIAWGYSSPESVMSGWMNSTGHRNNILSTNFREIGIGYVFQGDDQANVRYDSNGDCNADGVYSWVFYRYWTQNFGRISSVMPVVINREAVEATSGQVDLYMYGEGWATEMRFRNESGSWGEWQPYQANSTWQLSAGNGDKIVYAEIRDGGGSVRSAQDGIYLNSPEPQPASLAVSANAVAFALQADGPEEQSHTLHISNTGELPLTWSLTEETAVPWLTPSLTTGDLNGGESVAVTLTVSRVGLATAVYHTTLRIDAADALNTPQQVTITFLITEQSPLFLPFIVK